jgi:hypothetical protein
VKRFSAGPRGSRIPQGGVLKAPGLNSNKSRELLFALREIAEFRCVLTRAATGKRVGYGHQNKNQYLNRKQLWLFKHLI